MTARDYLTPPALAEQLGVKPAKVLAWINSGELTAINIAEHPHGERPRYRITQSAVDAFLASRSTRPPIAPARRQRKQLVGMTEYFK